MNRHTEQRTVPAGKLSQPSYQPSRIRNHIFSGLADFFGHFKAVIRSLSGPERPDNKFSTKKLSLQKG
jgi:hypothetical protein